MLWKRKYDNYFLKSTMLLVMAFCFLKPAIGQETPQASAPSKRGKNLVPNPSFETHKSKSSSITNAVPWRNVGTVDYYMKVDKKDTSKFRGARTGTCYGGLRFQPDYKEYMYTQLLQPLEKGKTYHFKMYVRLLGQSTVSVRQLGVYFSDDVFKVGMTFDQDEIVDSIYKKGISGALNWVPIQGDYVASGGEKYIIIGNFRTKMKEDFVKKNKWDIFEFKEAYYFIDDVSLRKVVTAGDTARSGVESKDQPVLPESFEAGQSFVIPDLQFEDNTANINKASQKILDGLVKDLNDHPFMEIQINGHTDNTGNDAVARKLSKERAKAVYDYLKGQGVINPMTYKGFGGSMPLVPNDSEANKAKNRRVEILILKTD